MKRGFFNKTVAEKKKEKDAVPDRLPRELVAVPPLPPMKNKSNDDASVSGSLAKNKMKKEEEYEINEKDRLSALPEPLIHHILSFLDMKVVVKTCVLSNRWRYLWLSTHTLNFDNNEIECDDPECNYDCESCNRKKVGFADFVDKVLSLTNSDIIKFNLTSDAPQLKPARAYSWVIAALGRNPQNIAIDITLTNKTLQFPDHLFTSSNVRVLELSCSGQARKLSGYGQARLPRTICEATHIKNLKLEGLLFPDGNVKGELILSFSVLENLGIWKSDVTHLNIISISAPLLESVDLVQVYTHHRSSCKVKMCAPNLKSVKLSTRLPPGWLPVEYCMENPCSLISANINIYSDVAEKDEVKASVKFWTDVLSWTYNVQSLKLVNSSLQALVRSPKLLERLPKIFHNLKHLTLKEDFGTSFDAELNFLEKVPCIQTLILERVIRNCDFGEDRTVKLPLKKIFTCLEYLEFRNFNGLEIEMKFLKLLLERAVVLKKMIIKMSWPLEEYEEKILSLPRASSSASILFSKGGYYDE